MTDVLDSPVTLRELSGLLTALTIEIVSHATITEGAFEATLTDIANDFLTKSEQSADPRIAAVLKAFAHSLIATEPGAGIQQ